MRAKAHWYQWKNDWVAKSQDFSNKAAGDLEHVSVPLLADQ
jgi:hypothetical protein